MYAEGASAPAAQLIGCMSKGAVAVKRLGWKWCATAPVAPGNAQRKHIKFYNTVEFAFCACALSLKRVTDRGEPMACRWSVTAYSLCVCGAVALRPWHVLR